MDAVNNICQKRSMKRQDKEKLKMVYTMIGILAENATKDVFATIPKSELEIWHASEICR